MGVVFIQLLLEFYYIHFVKNLEHNNFEQTNKIVLLFLKKKVLKNIMFCKDKCGFTMTFNIGIKFYYVQASSYIYLVQK